MNQFHPLGGATPSPIPIPAYLQRVFADPDLADRAATIAGLLAGVPVDAATALLAQLAAREVGWTRQILNGAGWLLINEIAFTAEQDAPSAWEGRTAA